MDVSEVEDSFGRYRPEHLLTFGSTLLLQMASLISWGKFAGRATASAPLEQCSESKIKGLLPRREEIQQGNSGLS